MQVEYFKLSELSGPLPYLTFTVNVGYYRGKAAMVSLPACQKAADFTHCPLIFYRPRMEVKQLGLSLNLAGESSKQRYTSFFMQTRFAQYKKLSVCAELQINVMCKEVNFLFLTMAFICGV